MSWIVPSLMMYLFSVLLYVFIRAAQKKQIPVETYSLWMFGFPAILLLSFIPFRNVYTNISVTNWLILVASAIFFSWLGNVFSQLSLLHAPNPGYPLIISKSYVVFTSFASIWLFGAPLTWMSIVGIILIVLFSALITLSDRKTNDIKKVTNRWFLFALGAFFCWGGLALTSKYLLLNGVSVMMRLTVVHVVVSGILISEFVMKKRPIQNLFDYWPILLGIGISGGLFNYFMQVGINLSPNPGFVNATNAASISAVTIASAILFKDQLSVKKMVGIVGVTIGLLFLFF